jgi:hypothetical protein
MDKLYLQLAKSGDLINILPLAYADSQKGLKVGIMACAEFADVLDGCSYVEKVVFSGRQWELSKALDEAKKLCANVICTQTNGPVEQVLKCTYEPAGQKSAITDSFNREAWKLSGRLIEWGTIPLVFDKRDKEREKLLMPKGWFGKGKKKRIMLVSADSKSSPFPYKDLLMELLHLKYPTFNIVDLSTIKAERFYDLLGFYESAHCLVSVDTAHLHLAYAVPTLPVMALVQDRQLYWHGSAWRPQHHFHCRYHDFPTRALEMFTAIENARSTTLAHFVQVFYGSIPKENDDSCWQFAIQPGSCHRDSVNVLQDKERHPMLRNIVRMFLLKFTEGSVALTRHDTVILSSCPIVKNAEHPSYAYRMNRKDGLDTFAPIVDLFAAPVEFWKKILPEIPDLVMGLDGMWSRVLLELFKANGAKEIEGIYRHA